MNSIKLRRTLLHPRCERLVGFQQRPACSVLDLPMYCPSASLGHRLIWRLQPSAESFVVGAPSCASSRPCDLNPPRSPYQQPPLLVVALSVSTIGIGGEKRKPYRGRTDGLYEPELSPGSGSSKLTDHAHADFFTDKLRLSMSLLRAALTPFLVSL